MRLPGTLPFLIWIQTCSYKAVGKKIEGYVQTSEMGWFGARKSCIEERGTDMFDPSETRHLEQSHYDNNTYYWVGGFETSQWIWTDNSPLFTNVGFCDVPTDLENEDIVDIPYNSVLGCYRKCNKYTIGLIGTNCYCLDEIDQSACSKESKNITMCFGNPVDHCGTESAMSVYNVDVPIKLDADDTDNICAYSKVHGIISSYIKVHPYDCNESLSSICVDDVNKTFKRCHNGLCVSTHEGPWISSNQSCSLAKFSFSEVDYFMELQYRLFKYWIGLHRTRLRHSITGKTVQLEFGNSDQDLLCLALMKTDGEWSEHWTPCNENHQSLCSSAGHSGYLVTTSYPPIPSVSDTFQTTSETPSSTGEDNEIPGTSSQTTEESQIGEGDALIENYAGKIGIYVGVGAGCLLLLAIICIIVMCKRKGYFCFERKEDCKTIAMENLTYFCPDDLENQVIGGSGHRGFGDPPTRNKQSEITDKKFSREEDDYYNNTTALLKNTGNKGILYDHLGTDEDNYDTAGVHRVDNKDDNTYDHTEPHADAQPFMVDNVQATYDHTGPQVGSNEMVDNEHDTYNHAWPRGGSNEMVDKEHDTCNQTEINHVVNVDKGSSRENVETYNHLRVSGSDKDFIDTSKCYSHLMADADSDYDTTRPVMDDLNDETYNHTMGDRDVKIDGSVETSSDYYNL